MAGVYDLVVFDFNGKKGTRMACDGPEGPTMLTALYNYVLLTVGGVEAPVRQPYFTKAHMKEGLTRILDTNIAHSSSGFDEDQEKILAFGSIILGLGSQEFVTPTLRSITSFDKSPGNGSNNVDLFNIMGIPLLHGWLANPEDESLYPYVRDYPYEMLQKYKEFLEGLEEKSSTADSDVPLNLALTKDLLDAHKKQLTPHGYATLCQTLSNGDFAVLYWDSKFNILHKGNGDLLLLEKDPNIVRQYPTARWRVFEEVDRDVIYLTSHYLPSEGQPNFERAKAWFESKVSGRVSEPDPSEITGSSKTKIRREQRRRAKKAAESSSNQAKSLQECIVGDVLGSSSVQPLPANKAGEEQGEVQQEAPKAAPISSDDKQVDSDGSTAEENRRLQTELDGNRCHQASGSSQESIQCQPSVCGTSSLSSAKEVKNKSSLGVDFLKFLLEFQDGESRLKDGSSTERVPYFEGVVEALKHTGSTKFYVPFEFIKMYDTSLAVDIQDNYPRISEDLTQSVRQYLEGHGVDIAAQLNILHLPEPRFNYCNSASGTRLHAFLDQVFQCPLRGHCLKQFSSLDLSAILDTMLR